MLAWLVLAVLCALAAFPKSLARERAALFAWSDQVFAKAKPTRILFWAAVLVAMFAFMQIAAADMAWLAALDAATFIELSAAVAMAGLAARLENVRQALAASFAVVARTMKRLARPRAASRAPRIKTRRKPPPPEDWAAAWA